MFPAGAAYPMLPPFEVVVAPEDMLTLPVNAVAEMVPLLLVTEIAKCRPAPGIARVFRTRY